MTPTQHWEIEHMIMNIIGMLSKVIQSLPIGIVVAVMICLILRKKYEFSKRKKTAMVVFGVYITILLQMTLFLRNMGQVREIDLVPFDMDGGIRYIILYSVANAVVFIPFGILIPTIWEGMRRIEKVIAVAFFASLFIEFGQYILQCGVSQTEDLLMNTAGAVIGYFLWKRRNKMK